MQYEAPTITELGAIVDMTRADSWALAFDGLLFHGNTSSGGGRHGS